MNLNGKRMVFNRREWSRENLANPPPSINSVITRVSPDETNSMAMNLSQHHLSTGGDPINHGLGAQIDHRDFVGSFTTDKDQFAVGAE